MAFNLKKHTSTLGGIVVSILIAFGTILLTMVLYFYVYLPAITNHNETVTVPDVVGRKYEELEEALGSRTLRYEVSDSTYSSTQPALTVLKQYPAAGAKVKENRVIYVSINRVTPPTVGIPNILNSSLINADALLKSTELKRGRIELVRGPFQIVKSMKYKGHPIEPGERVPKGSVIDLVVMDGGNSCFPLPDLLAKEWDEVDVEIKGINLNSEAILVSDTTGIIAVVLKQKPDAGQTICVGDIVKIWIGPAGTEIPEDTDDID